MQPIQAMARPEFYPHPCERVELLQTAMSWLLFAGKFVYKVKKPVRFRFLDATTPARRNRLCRDEVLLNRRLAPDVYVGINGIAQTQEAHVLVRNPEETKWGAMEFAVVMHRLPSERMLEEKMACGAVGTKEIQELAQKLAAFHGHASAAKSRVWGSARAISRLVTGNLAEAREIAADSVTAEKLAIVAEFARRYLISHKQVFDNRARHGYVREGHGDLRCESICFAAEGLAILDCVEYSEGLRYGDVACDLASLAVDFDLLKRPDLTDTLLECYVTETNDAQLLELLGFYKCYRAVLCAKLEILASLQSDLPTEQRITARTRARELFELARKYADES